MITLLITHQSSTLNHIVDTEGLYNHDRFLFYFLISELSDGADASSSEWQKDVNALLAIEEQDACASPSRCIKTYFCQLLLYLLLFSKLCKNTGNISALFPAVPTRVRTV